MFDSIRKTHEISQFDSASGVKGIKEDYDKIAYLIENFVDKFKPMYEEVYARYTAEVLAGSY
ncbi:hypothetical protein D3C71_1920750 [compost metagenome]